MTGKAGLAAWFVGRIELSRGTAGHNVRPMEGLRGFAVFLVFLVHYATLIDPLIGDHPLLHDVAEGMHTIGNRGVDLFFVLSGFLIYGSLMHRPQPFGRFMLRRVERIYPAFLVVFALYLALALAMPSQRMLPSGWLDASLYVVANLLLLPGLFPIEALLTVAWSLSYEMFYYLVMPVLIGALALRERSPRFRVTLFALLGAALAAYCLVRAGPIRLVMFVAGIVLFEAIRARRFEPPGAATALAAFVLVLLATLYPTRGSAGYTIKTLLLFAGFYVTCFSCFERPSWLSRAFSVTPLRWLGNMSYSYYLLHGLALKAAFMVLERVLPPGGDGAVWFWVLLPVMFAITLVPTLGLFLFVEYPLSLSPRRALKAPTAAEVEARVQP